MTRGRPALGMTRGRPAVGMTTAATLRSHGNRVASRNESEFAAAFRPRPPPSSRARSQSVMSSGAKRRRDICLRTWRTFHSQPDPSAALGMTRGGAALGMTRGRPRVGMTRGWPPVGMTRGRPPVGMTRRRPSVEMANAVTPCGHENRMASRSESEFATAWRPLVLCGYRSPAPPWSRIMSECRPSGAGRS